MTDEILRGKYEVAEFCKAIEGLILRDCEIHDYPELAPVISRMRCVPFGSLIYEMQNSESDLDLTLICDPKDNKNIQAIMKKYQITLKELANLILCEVGELIRFYRRNLQLTITKHIGKAVVPLLICTVTLPKSKTTYNVDLSVFGEIPLAKSLLTRHNVFFDPRIRSFLMLIKDWTHKTPGVLRKYNDKGLINSYTWTQLGIYYCQNVLGICPSLQAIAENLAKYGLRGEVVRGTGFYEEGLIPYQFTNAETAKNYFTPEYNVPDSRFTITAFLDGLQNLNLNKSSISLKNDYTNTSKHDRYTYFSDAFDEREMLFILEKTNYHWKGRLFNNLLNFKTLKPKKKPTKDKNTRKDQRDDRHRLKKTRDNIDGQGFPNWKTNWKAGTPAWVEQTSIKSHAKSWNHRNRPRGKNREDL